MRPKWVQRWMWLHRWCGIVASLNLAIVCLTGAVIVFGHELEELGTSEAHAQEALPGPMAPVLAEIQGAYPDWTLTRVRPAHDARELSTVYLSRGEEFLALAVDPGRRTFEEPQAAEGVVRWLTRLHIDLFLGLPGQILVGVMAGVWCLGSLAGLLVYSPFTRKRAPGQIRPRGRAWWADWHTLVGAASSFWGAIVGFSGLLLALSFIPVQLYAYQQVNTLTVTLEGPELGPEAIDQLVENAEQALPSHHLETLSFPGGIQGDTSFLALGHGDGEFGENMLEAAILRADTGEVVTVLDLPWYLQVIQASGPFHFGSFGGPLVQVVYTVLSIATCFLVFSGLWSWWMRRRKRPTRKPARASAGESSDEALT